MAESPDWQNLLDQTVRMLLDELGVVGTVKVRSEGANLWAEVETDDSALLIGWRGNTLVAFEYLTRMLLFRHSAMIEVPEIHIDVGGYKERQRQELAAHAKTRAARVRASGTGIILRPMNAFERRIVHLALGDEPGIVTESIGIGPNRRIMIKPQV